MSIAKAVMMSIEEDRNFLECLLHFDKKLALGLVANSFVSCDSVDARKMLSIEQKKERFKLDILKAKTETHNYYFRY